MPLADALSSAIEAQLTDEERRRAVVYLDDGLRPAGDGRAGGQAIAPGAAYRLAFIDRAPGANWMHPARYLVIDADSHEMASIDSNQPPVFGILPAGWRVVWRPAGIEDWRLMPIAPPQAD